MALDRVVPGRGDRAPDADDVLLAFEGGTGDKGEAGQPASQSLMGFVLLRTKPGDHYDVHIAFRGSRSGSAAGRSGKPSATSRRPAIRIGSRTWATTASCRSGREPHQHDGRGPPGLRAQHAVHLPEGVPLLDKVADLKRGISPDNIYVTGHSLGGALAQHFASAVLLGDRYGPDGAGDAMPAALRGWPWKQIKLITFSSPRAGDKQWAKTLTGSGLSLGVLLEARSTPSTAMRWRSRIRALCHDCSTRAGRRDTVL